MCILPSITRRAGLNRIQWCVGSGVNIRYISLIQDGGAQVHHVFFLLEILLLWNNLIIWNNYVEIHRKHMQVRIIIFRRTRWYNSLGDPTRQHEVWRKILLYYVNASWSDQKQNIPSYRGGGGQIFLKSFDGLVCVYKNIVIECQVKVWTVWMLILFLMPLNCRRGRGGGAFVIFSEFNFFVTIYTYKLLQAFPPKASVENSSAQWAIFMLIDNAVFRAQSFYTVFMYVV